MPLPSTSCARGPPHVHGLDARGLRPGAHPDEGPARALNGKQRRGRGPVMAAILDAPAEAERLGRLGTAFQLANFLRDVRKDYALDRIYLPADERDRAGVTEQDLAAGTATPALRQLVAADVRRARTLFADT